MMTEQPDRHFDAIAESNHRIANHLAIVGSLLRLHADRVEKSEEQISPRETALILSGVGAKVDSIARLHRHLSKCDEDESVDLGDYLDEICSEIISSLSPSGETVLDFQFDEGVMVEPGAAMRVGLIICELLTNALKYAHPSGVAGRVGVRAVRDGGALAIVVEDDGVGFPRDLDPMNHGGLGFRTLHSLTDEIGGSIGFSSDELGVVCTLIMPVPYARPAMPEEREAIVAAE